MKHYLSLVAIFSLTVVSTVFLVYILPFAFPHVRSVAGNVDASETPQEEVSIAASETPQKIDEQIQIWSDVVTSHPDYRDGHVQLAYYYYLRKDTQQAAFSINKALDIDPNYQPGITLRNLILSM